MKCSSFFISTPLNLRSYQFLILKIYNFLVCTFFGYPILSRGIAISMVPRKKETEEREREGYRKR